MSLGTIRCSYARNITHEPCKRREIIWMNLCPGTKRRYFLRMTRPSIVWLVEKLLCKHANSVRTHRGCQYGAGYGPVLSCTQRLVCIQSAAHLRTNMVKGRIELHFFSVSLRFQLAHNIKCWRKCSCVSSITQSLIEDLKEKKCLTRIFVVCVIFLKSFSSICSWWVYELIYAIQSVNS